MAKSNQGRGGLHSNERSIPERCTHKIPHSAKAGLETTLLASWSWARRARWSALFREHDRLHAGNFEALPAAHVLTGQ